MFERIRQWQTSAVGVCVLGIAALQAAKALLSGEPPDFESIAAAFGALVLIFKARD